jgi:hypothetical protein
MLPNQFQQGAKHREGLAAAPSMQEPMGFHRNRTYFIFFETLAAL